jgi:hypothetical protein
MKAEEFLSSNLLIHQENLLMSKGIYTTIIKTMNEFARLKCEEQRGICERHYYQNYTPDIEFDENLELIGNAPEPEL